MRKRWLPIDYAVRNLMRRPLRTVLTGMSSALIAALLAVTTAFVTGLDSGFASAGQEDVAILLSRVSQDDVLRSTVNSGVGELVAAAVPGITKIGTVPAVSPEIHIGTNVRIGPRPAENATDPAHEAFVRGVTDRAFLVHEGVTIVEGRAPRTGEVIVGRLANSKLSLAEGTLAIGKQIRFERGTFTIVGIFAAPGTTVESEIWAPLNELKGLAKRDDVSVVFVRLARKEAWADIELFTRRRLDLELNVIPSTVYYRSLASYFAPIRALAWILAILMSSAALFGGANTLNAAVQDRLRELATLRAIGYPGRALVASLLLESLVLAAAGGLLGLAIARYALSGSAIRIAMGAFSLDVGAVGVLVGFAAVLLVGTLGTAPAAVRVLRMPISAALKES